VSYEQINVEVRDAIATITLNRPERRNAYTPDMGDELVDAFRAPIADDSVRAIVMTGAGQSFCVGADRDYLAGKLSKRGQRLGEEAFINEFPLELVASKKPLIALINGDAVGIGVTMLLSFDVRLAAANARLITPFLGLGIVPGLGSTYLLPRLVGSAKAAELFLSNATIDAREAERIGLVNRAVEGEALANAGRELVLAMARNRPELNAATKRALAFGAGGNLRGALANERVENAALRS